MEEQLFEIEENIRGLLKLPIFDGFELFQVSISKNKLFVFLDGEVEGLETKLSLVKVMVEALAEKSNLEIAVFEHVKGIDKKITNSSCLSTIRKHSPIKIDKLIQLYREKDFSNIDEDSVSNVTDRLRRANLLVRAKDGSFYLTSKGFDRLGSRLGPDSPDVIRLLALASGKV